MVCNHGSPMFWKNEITSNKPPVHWWFSHENCLFFKGFDQIARTSGSLSLIFFQRIKIDGSLIMKNLISRIKIGGSLIMKKINPESIIL
jgi:hypothetical protein